MVVLLHLDASPSFHTSISRPVLAAFVSTRQARNDQKGEVLRRDLGVGRIRCVDETWTAATSTPATERTATQREILALSDDLVRELKRGDELVLGVPMYIFSVPVALKLWIDQVVRLGETCGFNGKERRGLLANKKAHVFRALDGTYDPGCRRQP